MDVKSAIRIAVVALLIAMLSVLSSAQSGQNSYDPGAGKGSSKPRDGFLDFTLKHINPSNQDYGQCLDRGRALLLDESLRKAYFWSNLVALSLLGCLLLIIIYQHRLQRRCDWTAAQTMTEYEQALARSNVQIDQLIKSNHGLNNALGAGQRASSTATEVRVSSSQSSPPSRTRASFVKPPIERTAGTAATAGAAPQMATSKVDADIVARINLLEQQLAYAQEDNKQLRRRVAEANRSLELEQQRNRQSQGA